MPADNKPAGPLTAILFDLDGTLLDTAQDLACALNRLLIEEGRSALPYKKIRDVVSNGGNALVSLGFDTVPQSSIHQALYQRLLALYELQLTKHTQPFPGIEKLLATLPELGLSWGVVTNKPSRYTLPIIDAMQLQPPCAAIVCADQVSRSKPDPESLLRACAIIGCEPQHTLYVGDHQRDVNAGHRAGMRTVAALYGYITDQEDPQTWAADYYIRHADQLTQLLRSINQSA